MSAPDIEIPPTPAEWATAASAAAWRAGYIAGMQAALAAAEAIVQRASDEEDRERGL